MERGLIYKYVHIDLNVVVKLQEMKVIVIICTPFTKLTIAINGTMPLHLL